MSDSSFSFGANIGTATALITESSRLTWRDIEADRRQARVDVATVADSSWSRALLFVARLKHPALKAWAGRWLTYCTTSGAARPVRHAGEAGKECRRVELQLARWGVIDPDGFEAVERPAPRKRKFKGVFRGVAGQLEEYRERMRGPWIG